MTMVRLLWFLYAFIICVAQAGATTPTPAPSSAAASSVTPAPSSASSATTAATSSATPALSSDATTNASTPAATEVSTPAPTDVSEASASDNNSSSTDETHTTRNVLLAMLVVASVGGMAYMFYRQDERHRARLELGEGIGNLQSTELEEDLTKGDHLQRTQRNVAEF